MISRGLQTIGVAGAAAVALAALAGRVDRRGPTAFDRRVRKAARSPRLRRVRPLLVPLFPFGVPGVYIPLAYIAALRLVARDRRGAPAIVAAAWVGWLAHRAAKAVYVRDRPPGPRVGGDSFPSGHSTAAAALGVTAAYLLTRTGGVRRAPAITLGIAAPLLMGASRVTADEHWATDVLGGWLLGAVVAGVVCAVVDFDGIRRGSKQRVIS